MRDSKIPEGAIRRLSRYLRYLEKMEVDGNKGVSSAQLATKCMVNAPLVRKDLSYFGKFRNVSGTDSGRCERKISESG